MNTALKWLGTLILLTTSSSVIAENAPASQPASVNTSARIIGGFETHIEQVPATVALLNRSRVEFDGDLFQSQFCGGTVISSRWVLTAAHCLKNLSGTIKSPQDVLVLTGSSDLDNPVNQPIAVLRVVVHPEFQRVQQGRDIALLQLEYDAMVQPIALDTKPVTLDESAFIAGWGAVNSSEDGRTQSFPKQLRGAFVNMTPGASCGTRYPAYNGYTDQSVICAGVAAGGRDSCQGDSGGPLYRVGSDDDSVSAITGITSWGVGCGVARKPGIYTNVSTYIDWIQENMQANTPGDQTVRPLNDGQTAITQASAPSSSSLDGQGRVFAGLMWASLLPLSGLLVWRKRCTS
ncbi:MAG: serine protease [Granulosicoccus sp.]